MQSYKEKLYDEYLKSVQNISAHLHVTMKQ